MPRNAFRHPFGWKRRGLATAADKTVSIDLLVKALVKTGVSVQEIGRSLEKIAPSKRGAERSGK